jgi:hypothetical protein
MLPKSAVEADRSPREHLAQGTAKLHHLPTATRAAVVRAMTWGTAHTSIRQILGALVGDGEPGLGAFKDATALALPIASIKMRRGDKRGPSIEKQSEGTLTAMFGEHADRRCGGMADAATLVEPS